jgi:hypothetical protein
MVPPPAIGDAPAMKHSTSACLFTAFLLAAACTKESAAATPGTATPQTPSAPAAAQPAAQPAAPTATASVADLPKVLAGIKDAATAEAAKAPLDAILQQLQAAKSAAGTAPAVTGTDLGKLAGDAATKLGASPEIVAQLGALLENPAIKAVIGPTLEKLQGLLK